MDINLEFRNKEQEAFFFSKFRNNEFDGAFANGKSYVGCERSFVHLMTFPNYAMSIYRQQYKTLRQTTMKTFFKICPDKLIHKHDEQSGYTVLINRSFIYWMHLDQYDEQDLRGLEINSALGDQVEEIAEPIYNVLDSRIGRWDKAEVPLHLLRALLSDTDKEIAERIERDSKKPSELIDFINQNTKWPRHPKWKRFLVPNYHDVLCNVAADEEFHWSYRYYNPESLERKPDHFYIHREMDQSLNDEKTYQQMLLRDEEWVNKYVKGLRGKSSSIIHRLNPVSIIKPSAYSKETFEAFITKIKNKGALYRILDHGETGITACGWLCLLNGCHIFYREYYETGQLISYNRKAIVELSDNEDYVDDIADPQMFKKTQQQISGAKSGFWTVAMEYSDEDGITDAPPLHWSPADNNEFATRNRINELMVTQPKYRHPITDESPAPGIYFIERDQDLWPYGIQQAILQIKNQRKKLLGEDNGKKIYSEERDDRIVDHAYDYVRYGVAAHNTNKAEAKRKPPVMSFEYYNQILKRRPKYGPASVY